MKVKVKINLQFWVPLDVSNCNFIGIPSWIFDKRWFCFSWLFPFPFELGRVESSLLFNRFT